MMFWGFLLATGFSLLLVKLGALSVWVSLLSKALLLALLVLACIGMGVLWKMLRAKVRA